MCFHVVHHGSSFRQSHRSLPLVWELCFHVGHHGSSFPQSHRIVCEILRFRHLRHDGSSLPKSHQVVWEHLRIHDLHGGSRLQHQVIWEILRFHELHAGSSLLLSSQVVWERLRLNDVQHDSSFHPAKCGTGSSIVTAAKLLELGAVQPRKLAQRPRVVIAHRGQLRAVSKLGAGIQGVIRDDMTALLSGLLVQQFV